MKRRGRPLKEEEKMLWACAVQGVSPLWGGVTLSFSSVEEGGVLSSLMVTPPPLSVVPSQKHDHSITRYRQARQKTSVPKTFLQASLKTSPDSVHKRAERVTRGVSPHPNVQLLRTLRLTEVRSQQKEFERGCFSSHFFRPKCERVESRLDLHGLSAQEAFVQFMAFMETVWQHDMRCVEIITGLGSGEEGGILRRELPHWLERADIRHRVVKVVYATHASNSPTNKATKNRGFNKGAVRIFLRQQKRGL